MAKVTLTPLEQNIPGQGNLTLTGVKGVEPVSSLAIQRNQDELFLQQNGTWESQPFKFALPADSEASSQAQAAKVDASIVDPLLESPNTTYRATLYDSHGNNVDQASMKIKGQLMASSAGGSTPSSGDEAASLSPADPTPAAAPEPLEPEPPAPESEPEPSEATAEHDEPAAAETHTPASAPPKPRKRKIWPFVLIGILLLVAAIIGGAYLLGSGALSMPGGGEPDAPAAKDSAKPAPAAEEPDSAAPSADTAPDSSANAACSAEQMAASDALPFVQDCLASQPDDIMQVINAAKAGEHCDIARRIYANQALGGNANAALAYAQEFDPGSHQASACFPEPDTETAVFWYETALEINPDQTDASRRLQELNP
ncbi:MAG: hypothetical protein ACTHXI_02895 [Halomonadaceae bacterium]|nr:hypothetical protein [Halomonas subglaciescola]